ncbi:hypothetical protein [Mycobacterium rhizamassiliense]|jgi:hypothetical protein|nr:hypothetical protein [Mycobacterium rhizamassiliense]
MTMKLRVKMSKEEAELEAKLSEQGLSVDDAQRVHDRVADFLGGEASFFQNTKKLLGADPAASSLEFSSVLWPGFEFKVITNGGGRLESARYWHRSRDVPIVKLPIGLPIWSMDVTEFNERFGPLNGGRKFPLFDELLPAYEEYQFEWGEENYGAGFCWGLFMVSAMSWD